MQTVFIQHEYFEGPWQGVSFRPLDRSFKAIQKHQIHYRETSYGFFIEPTDSQNLPDEPLVFLGYPLHSDYIYYTDLPSRGMLKHFQCLASESSVKEQDLFTESFREISSIQPPAFLVELPVIPGDFHYSISMKAKSMPWKYLLNSQCHFPELEIVDIGERMNPMLFQECSDSNDELAQSWITLGSISLRHQPTQRFQLREKRTSKVVLKRLPCANGKQLVKEMDAQGQTITVAEVYLNP